MRLSAFLLSDAVAREEFFVRAAPHVWPRILRTVREELDRLSGRDGDAR
jgi:hypothetical protein